MTTDAATKCTHCGQPPHVGKCPLVKAIEYYENGMVKRVEYMTAADYAVPYTSIPAPVPPLPPFIPFTTSELR